METKVKRLQIVVFILSIMFVISVSVSIYAASQIRLIADKLPNYNELKSDVKTLKAAYEVYSNQPDSLKLKTKLVKQYDYSIDKVSEFAGYLIEKRKQRNDK